MTTRLLPLLAVLVFGACDILGGNDQIEFQMFIQEVLEPPEDGPPPTTATVESGRIVVRGYITTDCLQNAPAGNVVQISRNQVHVVLTEERLDTGCTPAERLFLYNAFIGPLELRTYLVNVIHHELGASPETVFSQQVTVN
jgi:hypothetical protein